MQSKNIRRATAAALLAGLAGAAQAHTGHGTHSFMEGLTHPFGLDHLLAMVAVGVWSAVALAQGKTWQGPVAFLLALAASALLGASGLVLPGLEQAIALSVLLFGALLVLGRGLPPVVGLGLIVVAGGLHGLAHGAEAPAAGVAGYAAGFLLSTAALHLAGLVSGLALRRSAWALGGVGAALGLAGVALFGQLVA